MKKMILIIVLLVLAFWLASQRFSLVSSRSKDGTYNIVIVDKKSGAIHRLMGEGETETPQTQTR